MTEGCASPPTAAAVRRNQNNKSPYYNVVGYLSSLLIGQLCIQFGIRFDQQVPSCQIALLCIAVAFCLLFFLSLKKSLLINRNLFLPQIHNKKRRHSRKTADSEESDSDPDQITSSRTESSNHHEAKLKHGKCMKIKNHQAQALLLKSYTSHSSGQRVPRDPVKYFLGPVADLGPKVAAATQQIQVPSPPPISHKHHSATPIERHESVESSWWWRLTNAPEIFPRFR